ncbi:MAG: hypothetical protein ACUZ8E_00300 [Candidatus Anammoxibacter sp.]
MSKMKEAVEIGINFGLTSGVITTLGLMVGLHAGTKSTLAVIGGIITIAIADSLSDALGIHVAKEAEGKTTKKDVWVATISTLITKMVMALSFIVPVLLFDLTKAIIIGVIWGLVVLAILSYKLAKSQNNKPARVIAEHVGIAVFVVIATHYVGEIVSTLFV